MIVSAVPGASRFLFFEIKSPALEKTRSLPNKRVSLSGEPGRPRIREVFRNLRRLIFDLACTSVSLHRMARVTALGYIYLSMFPARHLFHNKTGRMRTALAQALILFVGIDGRGNTIFKNVDVVWPAPIFQCPPPDLNLDSVSA
jgi:hypothetical protein